MKCNKNYEKKPDVCSCGNITFKAVKDTVYRDKISMDHLKISYKKDGSIDKKESKTGILKKDS